MLIEKIIDLTTCWAKNKSNCANVLFSITNADQEKSTKSMRNKAFAQFDIFLVQQCSWIYNLFLAIITTRALGY